MDYSLLQKLLDKYPGKLVFQQNTVIHLGIVSKFNSGDVLVI